MTNLRTASVLPRAQGSLWAFVPLYAIAAVWYFLFPDQLHLGVSVLVMIGLVLSIDLILGFGGIQTLGQAALFGTGAYAAGLVNVYFGWTAPIPGLAIGALAGAVVAFLSSFIILRGNDLTTLTTTILIAGILHQLSNTFHDITGGSDGLLGIEMAPVFGVFEFDFWGHTSFIYASAVLFLISLLLWRLTSSPFGVMMRGIRDNPERMHAIGTPVFARRIHIYTIGGAVAGIAGALQTETLQFVSMHALSFELSATALTVAIIGGFGRLHGAFIGALIYMLFQDYVSGITPKYWPFWLGLLLVLAAIFMRHGIVNFLVTKFRRTARRSTLQ